MFIVKRCFDDGQGNTLYKSSCIIGIYDLLSILQKLKYEYSKNDILLDNKK